MKIPTLQGLIDLRMLVNFIADRRLFKKYFLNLLSQKFITVNLLLEFV